MEFLVVRFTETRTVLVDGVAQGRTNLVLQFEAGRHTVTLGPPRDFSPLEQIVLLESTAALDPYKIKFFRLPPAAIPVAPGGPA